MFKREVINGYSSHSIFNVAEFLFLMINIIV
ncbi:putative membrane protein [Yersinia pestis]|nr:putative membrane protein [Yersinia pestis]